MWTIEAGDGSAWTHFARQPDGALYLLGDDHHQRGRVVRIARFNSEFELEWSRRLVHGPDDVVDAEHTAMLGSHVLDTDGAILATDLSSGSYPGLQQQEGSWLTRIDDQGVCANPIPIEFGGAPGHIGSVLREPDSLVLGGTVDGPGDSDRGFVQRRTLDGALLTEIELSAPFGEDVSGTRVYAYWPDRYMVTHAGYNPYDHWGGSYRAAQIFDESLSPIASFARSNFHLGFGHDLVGRLYSTSRSEWEGAQDPFESAPPATAIYVKWLATPDQPSDVDVELTVPQPQCGEVDVIAVFDESLVVVLCQPFEAPSTLMGYVGAGAPTWTATLRCSGATDLHLTHGLFGEDGRLWLAGPKSGRVVVVEF